MKVSYPLSLKVSLWLMANLLLLAAVALGFFIVNGGLRWDALVAGPSGERIQALANIIAGEASATTGAARTAVLKRFGVAYKADFYLFTFDDNLVAGTATELPEPVRTRMEFRRLGPGFGPPRGDLRWGKWEGEGSRRRDGGEKGSRDGFEKGMRDGTEKGLREGMEKGTRDELEKGTREPGEKGRSLAEGGRREPPPNFGGPPSSELPSGRFIVRAGTPAAYWVGLRVPFTPTDRTRPVPSRLVARVPSLWGLLHLLNLQSWVLAATAVLVLSILFWLPLVRGITRSIGQLTAATEQIAEGKFDTRVAARRRDELGRLGDSVNRMASRLDAHMTGQKRFLGDVAHELCSPLARLQMATGILSDQAPKELQQTVTDVRDEVQQMSTLVNELLAFTKSGMQPRDVALAPVELESLVPEVLARENTGGRVTLNIAPGLTVLADRELLGRALGNVVRNALRYGEAGPITVSAARENGRAVIAVEDEGPGVPAADLDRLGEPFFRPDLARTREGGGVGLGLAIVRNSVAACGGEVRFENRKPRGFRVEFRLKAA